MKVYIDSFPSSQHCVMSVELNFMIICDWILEKQSKSHIRSFKINGFKEFKHNSPRIASTHMKFTQKMHQSITFQAISSTCSCL